MIKNKFGQLICVTPIICVEATESLKVCDFYKTEDKGGIFAYVDNNLLSWFGDEVKNSPAKELLGHQFTKEGANNPKLGEVYEYEEMDLAHIKQICERHIIKGEKLLREKGSNLFWVRKKIVKNKKGVL